jgi:cell division protein FtsL
MIRPGTVIWLLLVIAVGYAMFQVKYEVMQQEEMLTRINREITETRDQIRVLDAEWSYLTQPNRLKRLATRYLDLAPISSTQILALTAVPDRAEAPPTPAANQPPARSAQQPAPRRETEMRITPATKGHQP